jgi:hypothetical protein
MKTILYAVTVTLACAALFGCPAAAADREWIDYKRLLEITRLDKFYAAPPGSRDKVRLLGTVQPNNAGIAAQDIVFTVVRGAQVKRITVDREGRFDPAIDPAWARDNPKVLTNMPAGEKARFSFAAEPIVPPGTRFGYAALMAGVRQSNALVKEQGGMMRFLMPTFSGIELRYPPGQAASALIVSARGEAVVAADAQGALRLKLDESLAAANAEVILSHAPQAADLIAE